MTFRWSPTNAAATQGTGRVGNGRADYRSPSATHVPIESRHRRHHATVTDDSIRVRHLSHYQFSWIAQEPGEDGVARGRNGTSRRDVLAGQVDLRAGYRDVVNAGGAPARWSSSRTEPAPDASSATKHKGRTRSPSCAPPSDARRVRDT
jgi:hypothetical protein